MIRGQQSMEFILIFVFSLIIFVLLFGMILSGLTDQEEARLMSRINGLSHSLVQTIDLIDAGPSDAHYTFTFPETLDGHAYSVEFRERTILVRSGDLERIRSSPQIALIGDPGVVDTSIEPAVVLSLSSGMPPCSITIRKRAGTTEVDVHGGC